MALYECSKAELKPIVLNGRALKRIYSYDSVCMFTPQFCDYPPQALPDPWYRKNSDASFYDLLISYGKNFAGSNIVYLEQNNHYATPYSITNLDAYIRGVSNNPLLMYGAVASISSRTYTERIRFLTTLLIVEPDSVAHSVYDGVQTKIGYIELEGVNTANGGQTPYLTVYEDSTKSKVLLARAGINSNNYASTVMNILKMNDSSYLCIWSRSIKSTTPNTTTQNFAMILTKIDDNTVKKYTNGIAIGGGDNTSAAYSNTSNGYLISMREDNTDFLCYQHALRKTISTGNWYSRTSYYNNFRWRSSINVGLRTTAWTAQSNNAAYLASVDCYEGIGMDWYTYNQNNNTAVGYYSWFMRNNQFYGNPLDVKATSQIGKIDPDEWVKPASTGKQTFGSFRTYGLLQTTQGVDKYIYIDPRNIASRINYIYTDLIRISDIDGTNRTFINKMDITYDTPTRIIDDLAWQTLIVNENYSYPSFAFMKEGLLIIGMRKESYKSNQDGSLDYEETIRCMAYRVIPDYENSSVEFEFSGVCEGGTFRNKNLNDLNLSTHHQYSQNGMYGGRQFIRSIQSYAPYFDAHGDQWYYDPFRNYILEYDMDTSI